MKFFKKIISIYKNIHFQSLLGNGVMAVIGMVTLGLLYRSLPSTMDVGIYVFFLAILNLTDTFRGGFLMVGFIKFYSGTEKRRGEEVAGSAWYIASLITGFIVLLNVLTYLLIPHIQDESMTFACKYFSIVSVATLPSFMATCALQGEKRFDKLLWLRMINQGLFLGAIIVLMISGKTTLNAVIFFYVLSNLITSLLVLLFGWTMISSITKSTKATVMELFHFGKYSVGTNISTSLFAVTNTYLINFFVGPAGLAIYNLGGKLVQIIEIPLLSFAASSMSVLASYYNEGKRKEMMATAQRIIGMLTIALIPIILVAVVFAEPIIGLLGGGKYVHTEAPNLFRMFMCISLLYPADRFFALTLDVIHKPKINFYKVVAMLLVNMAAISGGLYLFHSVYTLAIASIFPTLIAIIVAYYPLKHYFNFRFMDMYVMGYKEVTLLFNQKIKPFLAKAVSGRTS